MEKITRLSFIETLLDAPKLVAANFVPLLCNVALSLVALWIPYINIGVAVALLTLPGKIAHNEKIDRLEIFKPVYRKQMGEYLILLAIACLGVVCIKVFLALYNYTVTFWAYELLGDSLRALAFASVGYIMLASWLLAPLFIMDEKVTATEALSRSSGYMNGNKLTLFLLHAIIFCVLEFCVWLFGLIPYLGTAIAILLTLFAVIICICLNGYVYKILVGIKPTGTEIGQTDFDL